MRYMIYWDDLILWWPLSYFGLSMSVTILRCLSEPSFMFVTHCQERNLCYFTQKSLLVVVVVVGGGGGGIAIIESAPGPDLWDLRWRWYWYDLYMTWAWPGHGLDPSLTICHCLLTLDFRFCLKSILIRPCGSYTSFSLLTVNFEPYGVLKWRFSGVKLDLGDDDTDILLKLTSTHNL